MYREPGERGWLLTSVGGLGFEGLVDFAEELFRERVLKDASRRDLIEDGFFCDSQEVEVAVLVVEGAPVVEVAVDAVLNEDVLGG